jgi:predicted enzyme related to lactoylglutathione lyase
VPHAALETRMGTMQNRLRPRPGRGRAHRGAAYTRAMERVRSIGGIFFKANDPKALGAWYRDHRGVPLEEWGGAIFTWRDHDPGGRALTVWSLLAADTDYFAPSTEPFMVNFRVADLDAMLAQLRTAGAAVVDKIEESELGRFGSVVDPEGNKI